MSCLQYHPIWSETWTFRKLGIKNLKYSEMAKNAEVGTKEDNRNQNNSANEKISIIYNTYRY